MTVSGISESGDRVVMREGPRCRCPNRSLPDQGNAFAIDPPLSVELVVTETEPGVKGNTATGATKPAIVETGAKVNVPLFVDQGETIKIDTRTGAYLSRA